jgi:hypothetical protein
MTQTSTTTTTTTTTSTQTGVQLSVQTQANTQQIGNFVTNVSLNPYIAPQIISFVATGLRPNITVHAFFDSVLVDQYCAPAVQIPSADTSTQNYLRAIAPWGTALTTDSYGNLYGQFNIPANTFKTGDRIFEIADVTNLAQGNGAITTQATSVFTASNLNVTKQGVTLTTVNPILRTIPVTNTVITTNTVSSSLTLNCQITRLYVCNVHYAGGSPDPIAQALTIKLPDNSAGVFATSIDLFFEQKPVSNTNGITVYICETNNGYPDGSKILPFSMTHLAWSNVVTSSDASVKTTFTFESPVFMNNDQTYAFVVKPDGGDPDYRIYNANLGDTDITTGIQVFSQPVVGTAFLGSTTIEWTALQTKYIKFNLNVAQFYPLSGVAKFNNANNDFLLLANLAFNNSSASILPGDYVIQAINSTPSTADTTKYGIVRSLDTSVNLLYIEQSTGNFSVNSFVQIHRFGNSSLFSSPGPNTTTIQATANTGSTFGSIPINALVPNFAMITPAGTSVNYDYIGTNNTYSLDSNSNKLVFGTQTCFFDYERRAYGKSSEAVNMSGSKSVTIEANLISDSIYLSPLIDTVKSYQQVIGNLVSPIAVYYNEFYNNGSDRTKYISQIITLAPGQDAEDLQIILTAHRPVGTDIKVYAKFLNSYDPDSISNKTWTPLLNGSPSLYSNPSNPYSMNEFTYTVSKSNNYLFSARAGTITATSSCTTVTGVGTNFGNDVTIGTWLAVAPNSTFTDVPRQVIAIANTTQLTLNAPFNGNWTANTIYLVAPPTTAWVSATTNTQISGTVSANTTTNIVTGSSTSFTTLSPGQIIQIGGYEQTIVSITNSTSLAVGTVWPATFTGANAYIITSNGLTYLNSNNNLYTTFRQFQIKVNLESNDSSKVPILNDLTALALQL